MGRLQTTGAIDLDDIQTAFGGSNPIGIDEYYRDGSNVPTNSVNGSIPTSGAISLDDFYGGDGTNIITASALQTSPVDPSVTYTSTGGITVSAGTDRTWHNNGGPGSDYEIRAVWTGGGISGPASGTWNSLSTDRSWSKATNGITSLTITIRTVSGSVTVDTGTATLNRDSGL